MRLDKAERTRLAALPLEENSDANPPS
jgi:hypothetical protein